MIVIIDYNLGNLKSVAAAVERIGEKPIISNNRADIEKADKLILPGVGAFRDGMQNLRRLEIIEPLEEAVRNGKPVLGICLGSQLIAASLGAKVYPNKFKEIGWFDIKLTQNVKNNFLFTDFPHQIKVFQWHEDTFDLPKGSQLLAQSEVCKNQAFIFKEKILALQFHSEVTENSLREMIEKGKTELKKGNYIQTPEEILHQKELITFNNHLLTKFLNKLEQL